MRKILLAAFAATTMLFADWLAGGAQAMTPASRAELGAATGFSMPIERTAVVCGTNGCARVYTKRVQRPARPVTTAPTPPRVVSTATVPPPQPSGLSRWLPFHF